MGGALTGKMRGLLLSRIRTLMIVVAAVAGLLVVGTTLIDEGEIVKLETVDSAGRKHVTELWIVDTAAGSFLRSGSAETRWLERIRSHPDVVLTRGEQVVAYRAVLQNDDAIRTQVNDAMRGKYGFADQIWDRLGDRTSAVPVLLVAPAGRTLPLLAH